MSQRILGVFPVDTPAQVKVACDYFDEHAARFNLRDRVDYARELAPLVKQAGLELTDKLAEYCGPPREDVSAGFHIRYKFTHAHHHEELRQIEKVASARVYDPDSVADMLYDFDVRAGIAHTYGRIPDPHQALFYNEKTASVDMPDDTWTGPTDTLRRHQLESWVQSQDYTDIMRGQFPIDLVNSMRDNPWPIFSSLPEPHKTIIARMCNDKLFGTHSSTQSVYDVGGAIAKSELHRPANQMKRELDELHNQQSRIVRVLNRK